jgi:hypothetical protein
MEEGKQPQIPPLGCGMTTKEQAEATATADSLRNDNKWHVRLYANCYFSLKDLLANASAQRKPKIERFPYGVVVRTKENRRFPSGITTNDQV